MTTQCEWQPPDLALLDAWRAKVRKEGWRRNQGPPNVPNTRSHALTKRSRNPIKQRQIHAKTKKQHDGFYRTYLIVKY